MVSWVNGSFIELLSKALNKNIKGIVILFFLSHKTDQPCSVYSGSLPMHLSTLTQPGHLWALPAHCINKVSLWASPELNAIGFLQFTDYSSYIVF